MREDGSSFEKLPLPDAEGGLPAAYGGVSVLPDGRLGLVRACSPPDGRARAEYALLAFDPERTTLETLAKLDRPLDSHTWDPPLRRGLYSRNSGICAGIGALSRAGLEPLEVSVVEDVGSWRIDSPLVAENGDCSSDEGRAKGPAWSPDGSAVAFLASPRSIGVSGADRVGRPWNLYVMHPERREPRAVLREILEPSYPVWSPDGRMLALLGQIPNSSRGLLLLSFTDGGLWRAATGEVAPASWSPDGKRLLAIRRLSPVGEWPLRSEPVIVELRGT